MKTWKSTKFSKAKQDGNVPSRRHISGSKIFKKQLLEIFGNFFFKKIIFEFFSKKVFFKSHNAEKLKKRPFRLIQRFLQTENFKKNARGYPLIKFEKSRIVPKKTQRGDPLVSPVLLEALKSNPRSPAWSKMEDEQI